MKSLDRKIRPALTTWSHRQPRGGALIDQIGFREASSRLSCAHIIRR